MTIPRPQVLQIPHSTQLYTLCSCGVEWSALVGRGVTIHPQSRFGDHSIATHNSALLESTPRPRVMPTYGQRGSAAAAPVTRM